MIYSVLENTKVNLFVKEADELVLIDSDTLVIDIHFDETEFMGYEQCECCGTRYATFDANGNVDDNGSDGQYYMQVNARYVVECSEDAEA